MKNRIVVFLAALIALIGLAAPAASASPAPKPVHVNSQGKPARSPDDFPNCNPCHIVMNALQGKYGITYPGVGSPADVTTSPGTSTVEADPDAPCCDGAVIHNNNGNCLKMDDAANLYVVEEEPCDLSNSAQQFWTLTTYRGDWQLESVEYGQLIGVSCHPSNGSVLFGESGATGLCVGWQMVN